MKEGACNGEKLTWIHRIPNLLRPLDRVANFWPKESGEVEWMVTFPELPVEAYEAPVGLRDTDHATKRAARSEQR